jgi:hypothetical protein
MEKKFMTKGNMTATGNPYANTILHEEEFNPITFMYLNPEVVCEPENAYDVYKSMIIQRHSNFRLHYDVSTVPPDFDAHLYIVGCKSVIDISLINKCIRESGDDQGADILPTLKYHAHVCSGGDTDTPSVVTLALDETSHISNKNLSVGDEVRIDRYDAKTRFLTRTCILSVSYVNYDSLHIGVTTDNINALRSFFHASGQEFSYELYGHRLYNPRRLAIINYVRGARNLSSTSSSSTSSLAGTDFNPDLYRLLYPDARGMTNVEAYEHYMAAHAGGDVRICTVKHMPQDETYIQDTMGWASNIARSAMNGSRWASNMMTDMRQNVTTLQSQSRSNADNIVWSEQRVLDHIHNTCIRVPQDTRTMTFPSHVCVSSNMTVHGSATIGQDGGGQGIALDVRGGIRAQDYLVSSDERIKQNILPLDPEHCLQRVLDIDLFDYQYKAATDKQYYGFLAQQLESIDPRLVRVSSEFIPNIMSTVAVDRHGRVHVPKHTFDIGEQIKVLVIESEPYTESVVTVRAVNAEDGSITIDNPGNGIYGKTHIMYGTLVKDFRSVDVAQVLPLIVGAVQSLFYRTPARL